MFGTAIDRAGDSFVNRVFERTGTGSTANSRFLSTKTTKTTKFLSCPFSVFSVFRGSKTTARRPGFSVPGKFRGGLSQKSLKLRLSNDRAERFCSEISVSTILYSKFQSLKFRLPSAIPNPKSLHPPFQIRKRTISNPKLPPKKIRNPKSEIRNRFIRNQNAKMIRE
ncbi:MAG: hypothetical protein JSS81_10540 [Acidobacteria bacterium]|nr:hypothetical protein [Acidobacteriota bacterium]